MKIVEQDKKKAVLEDILGDKKYNVTMIDMSGYIGFRSRPWYVTPKPVWKAMSMDVSSPKKDGYTYESLVDEHGDITRVTLKSEDNKVSRIRHYDFGQIEDTIYIDGVAYKYDQEQKSFMDERGNVAPASQFSQYGMLDSTIELASTIEQEYKLMLENEKTNNRPYDF